MDFVRITVIFIVLPIIAGLGDEVDIQTRTTECLQKILPGSDVEDIASSSLPNWELRKFKQVCGDKKEFDVCIDAIPKNSKEQSLEIVKEILQKKFDFLCGFGSNSYTHHKACLAKDAVQKKVTTCSQNFGKNYERTSKTNTSQCAVIDVFRNCVRTSANICGSDARTLIATYMDFNVESFTGTPECIAYFSGAPTNHFTFLNLMLPAVALWLKTL